MKQTNEDGILSRRRSLIDDHPSMGRTIALIGNVIGASVRLATNPRKLVCAPARGDRPACDRPLNAGHGRL